MGLVAFTQIFRAGSYKLVRTANVKLLADAVIYTWLYNHTHGSLLLTTILHAAGNTAGVFLPMANTQSGEHADVYIMAIVFLILTATGVTVAGSKRESQRVSVDQ